MQSFPRTAILALALLVAGCSGAPPAPSADPASTPAASLKDFSWTGVGELGDRYMHLRVEATEPVTCALALYAQGLARGDQQPAQVGVVSGDQAQVSWGSRGVAPSAKAGGAYQAPVDQAFNATWYVQSVALDASLARGEHVLYWAAADVQPRNGAAIGFAASMACDGEVRVLERAIGDAPLMFRESGPDGVMVTDGLSSASSGTLAYDQPGPALFAFEDHAAVAGTLDLQHAAGAEHWDLQGAGAITGTRDGLTGPFTLALTRAAGPVDKSAYTGSLTGILAAYRPVDEFPAGIPAAPAGQLYQWGASLDAASDQQASVLWDLEVELAREAGCSASVDAAGVAPYGHMSVVYGRYAADGPAEMTWTSEPVPIGETSLGSEGPGDPSVYDKQPRTWSFATPAGRNHFYWGASGASALQAGLVCDQPFAIVARSASTAAAFPRGEAFEGTWVTGGFADAHAQTTYDFAGDGPTLFLWEDHSFGAGTLRMEHGGEPVEWQLGLAGDGQGMATAQGPVHLTRTSASGVSFWYGILGAMQPVDLLPGEA